MSVAQELVDDIHQEVGLRLNHEQKKRVNDGLPELSIADERQLIRALTQSVIEERTGQMAAQGVPPLHPADERELAEKVVSRLSTNADPDLARRIHRDLGSRLSQEQTRRRTAGQPELTGASERMFADKLLSDVLSEHADQQLAKGQSPLDPTSEKRLREAVTARLFGAGRLDELLKDESIENIDINGFDRVWVTRAGSTTHELVDPVASSDDELIELIQGLAAYSGLNSRPWDTANPQLDLQLPDGSRLSAVQSVSTRPSISIRRDRLEKVELADLVGNGTVTEEAADLLRALIKGRFNVMVAGATRAGKTTLLRALAAEIGPHERIITIERSLELGLARYEDRHPNCVEFEERLANSEGLGAVSMKELVRRTLRQNPDRAIVGEVLGPEVVDMLNAMSQGNDGSLSTIHARSARQTFERIATYAIQAEERLPHEATYAMIAGALDYVVYISQDILTGKRRLETILEVTGFDGTVGSAEIFKLGPSGDAEFSGVQPSRFQELAAAGWRQPEVW
ncbi:CpaF family protein [Nocardioides sp. NPDC057764]|uniref:CpaF family protein n=1 Tax=Nocardioides sp. NPDC057764 TaxID=3346243 RepID=UPI00366B6A5A